MCVKPTLVFLTLMCFLQPTVPCLMISEVNCDNPSLDTTEFVELYYYGTNPKSLAGYTLVFYNGKGNQAYKVIDLSEHHTDKRGFFIVGSSDLNPPPSISLRPNSIQNGPDAIALYGPNWAPIAEGGNVSGVGLVDAVVYMSRKSTVSADGLASVLTPGLVPYVEDDTVLEEDESIQRCWESGNLWTFSTGAPTPLWFNHCPPSTPMIAWINEVDITGRFHHGTVELSVATARPLSLVLYDVTTDRISFSQEVEEAGIISLAMNTSALSVPQSAALALYTGPVSDFPMGSPLSHNQPIDAFVYGDASHMPSDNLIETLIPGRKPFLLPDSFQSLGLHVSRCGVSEWTRDPGLFIPRPQSLGKPNDCPWFYSCPNITLFSDIGQIHPLIHSDMDFLLNEINTDSPGSADDEEFIELWHPSGSVMSLEHIWLLLFDGQTGLPYYEQNLNRYHTNNDGYFLMGNHKVSDRDFRFPSNTIGNGPGAIALYRSGSSPLKQRLKIPRRGLLDAVVYSTRGTDSTVSDLIEALTPRQLPLLEDINALVGDETLSRCGTGRFDLNAFRVTSPTPGKPNNCPLKPIPAPPEGLVINEWGKTSAANQSQGALFVELTGPPSTPLKGLILVFLGVDGKELSVPLTGRIGRDRFYVIGNYSSADQGLPAVGNLTGMLLCFEASGSGIYGNNSRHLDWIVFSDDPKLQKILQHNMTRNAFTANSKPSLSRCASNGPVLWLSSTSTPRLPNLCPNPAFSSTVDLCLQPDDESWQRHTGNCDQERFAVLLERSCDCGLSILHIKGVNVSCESDRLYAQGSVLAVSAQQREQISEILNTLSCQIAQTRGADSPVGLQVGLVLAVFLLFALGAGLFIYLYRKRRSSDYLSMQLSEQAETPLEL